MGSDPSIDASTYERRFFTSLARGEFRTRRGSGPGSPRPPLAPPPRPPLAPPPGPPRSYTPPMPTPRALRRLARACGVTVAAGPGCFLFFPCDSSITHTETRTISTDVLEWYATAPPGGPSTAAWMDGDALRLAGPDGAVRSFDGGATWEPLAGAPTGIAAMDAVSGWEPWFVGADGLAGVWRDDRFDAGTIDGAPDLVAVAVYEGYGGVTVATDGTLYTSETGAAWAEDPDVSALAEGAPLADVDLLSDGTMWVVGAGGLVLHADDDGWATVDLGTTADLSAVSFASVNRGLLATIDGTVFETNDAGATWVATTAPGAVTTLVHTGTADRAVRWAAGPDGVVWASDGARWNELVRTDAPVTALAAWSDEGLVAGADVRVLGRVEHVTEEEVEVPDCLPYEGRPYRVAGVPRLATVHPTDPDADPRWLRQAQEEHASIFAFACFARQLRALGAPADLVADALAAQADEARHAALALAMAGGGTFGAFPAEDADDADASTAADAPHHDDAPTLLAVARATAREGCIVETAAVYAAIEAARAASTPDARAVWRAITRDETRHAALAWRFLRWAIAEDPTIADAIAPLFARRPPAVPAAVWDAVIAPAARSLTRAAA